MADDVLAKKLGVMAYRKLCNHYFYIDKMLKIVMVTEIFKN